MISGRLRFVLSQALLTEHRRVLLRPAIACRHGLSGAEVDRLLEDLAVNAMVREPPDPGGAESPAGGDLAVPGDEHVLALLRAAPGAVLVSGDLRLRDAVVSWGSAVSPAEFAGGLA